jgi:hypothetical protein
MIAQRQAHVPTTVAPDFTERRDSAHPRRLFDVHREVLVFAHLDGTGGGLGFVGVKDVEVG